MQVTFASSRHQRILLQPVPDNLVHLLARRRVTDAVNDLAREGVDQHPPRRLQADAPRAQVKNGFVVQLPDRRAVRAFHVVRVNLQLRLGVHRRVLGEQQVFVRLLGVGLLRVGPHQDAAVENALRTPVQDAVVIFVAVAMRFGVLDDHVVVRQLVVPRQVKPVQHAFHAFVRQAGADVVARKPRAGGDGMRDEIAVPAQMRVDRRDVKRLRAFVLELAMLHHRVLADHQLVHGVREMRRVRRAHVTFDDRQPGCSSPR